MNALVLAAGKASRLGVPKLLLPAGPNETLVSRAVAAALAAVSGRVAVVIGREAALMRAEVMRCSTWQPAHQRHQQRLVLVENPNFQAGLSTSLKAGLHALGLEESILVLLADQPALEPKCLELLVASYRSAEHLAVAAACRSEVRPPVVFAPELLPEVLATSGDEGARKVLARHRARVRLVEWGEGIWFSDVDSWEDYRRLVRACGWHHEATPRLLLRSPLPPGALHAARRALAQGLPPYLRPDTLFLPFSCPSGLYSLPAPLGSTHQLALGPAATAEAYLALLRRAALTLLSGD